MHEAANLMGWLSAGLLVIALAAWLRPRSALLMQWAGRQSPSAGNREPASRILVVAVATGAIAALLSILAWASV